MLELAILGLLEEQEQHGYELKKRLGDTLGLLASVSFGSLYPALGRLEATGAVEAVTPGRARVPEAGGPQTTARIPMTGSLGGEWAAYRGLRAASQGNEAPGAARPPAQPERGPRDRRPRKVYAITESGRALFTELLAGAEPAADDDRCFALRLAFARHLSPEARLRLLERRRAVLAQRRDRAATTGTVDPYRAALAERQSEALDDDIRWLDRLVRAERARANQAGARGAPAPTDPGPSLDTKAPVPAPFRAPTRKAGTA